MTAGLPRQFVTFLEPSRSTRQPPYSSFARARYLPFNLLEETEPAERLLSYREFIGHFGRLLEAWPHLHDILGRRNPEGIDLVKDGFLRYVG